MFSKTGDFLQRLQGYQWLVALFVALSGSGAVKAVFRDLPLIVLVLWGLAIFFGVLLVWLAFLRPAPKTRETQQEERPFRKPFKPSAIHCVIKRVDISGLLTENPSQERIRIFYRILNRNDIPITINTIAGSMHLGSDNYEVAGGDVYIESGVRINSDSEGDLVLVIKTPHLRQTWFQKGIYSKTEIIGVNLSNLVLHVVGEGTEPNLGTAPQGEVHFLIRGPLREDDDYVLSRQSISFGSINWYSADGPNRNWLDAD
jgi:hypothetical protein